MMLNASYQQTETKVKSDLDAMTGFLKRAREWTERQDRRHPFSDLKPGRDGHQVHAGSL